MSKHKVEIPNQDEMDSVCCRCWYSVCDPTNSDCDNHPITKDRWCHKHHKSVWNLEDASNCKDYWED